MRAGSLRAVALRSAAAVSFGLAVADVGPQDLMASLRKSFAWFRSREFYRLRALSDDCNGQLQRSIVFRRGVSTMIGNGVTSPQFDEINGLEGPDDADGGHFSISVHRQGRASRRPAFREEQRPARRLDRDGE
jgi:hypothetical protein